MKNYWFIKHVLKYKRLLFDVGKCSGCPQMPAVILAELKCIHRKSRT